MDNTPINLQNILEQAANWTFAGDFTLLQWMNQISQDLETRATKTTEALNKLNNNVRSTSIALDNVANSLTTLQFGNQFVECRVQDDDESVITVNNASYDGNNQMEHVPTSKEMLITFLDNNLKVLRNCHEKYSIDLEDSDDDEKSFEKTCIYQPVNPYNERPLPFIFGSKDWHSKWHVGLHENQQDNSYSGDEISEEFSESSSSHLEDNESFESNTEWASNNSLGNDNLNTKIEVKNASSLRGSQSLYPETSSTHINAVKNNGVISESSSLSTPSSSVIKNSIENKNQSNHVGVRTEIINSINSSQATKNVPSYEKEIILPYKTQQSPFVDLFAEPPDDIESTTSSSVSPTQNKKCSSNDDRTSVPNQIKLNNSKKLSNFRAQAASFVDLFAEPPEDNPSSTTSSLISSKQNVNRKTVNLFDDYDERDIDGSALLSGLIKKAEIIQPGNDDENEASSKPKSIVIDKSLNISKTSKSLFEDSDDDDDFLKAFAKPSSQRTTKYSLPKTISFDNDFNNESSNVSNLFPSNLKENVDKTENFVSVYGNIDSNIKRGNIFNDVEKEYNEEELLFNRKTKDGCINTVGKMSSSEDSIENESAVINANVEDKFVSEKESTKKSINLFDDFEEIFKIDNSIKKKDRQKAKKINLFDEMDESEDLFTIKSKQVHNQNIDKENAQQANIKDCFKKKSVESFKDVKDKFITATNEIIPKEIGKISCVEETKSYANVNISEVSNKITSNDYSVERNSTTNKISPKNIENKEFNKIKDESNVSKTIQFENKSASENKIFGLQSNEKKLNNNNTLSRIQIETESSSTAELIKTKRASNKYDFNSVLFLDEPPEDDNEFFESLTKTSQTLNSNYNAIDLENDLYEPELPEVPVVSTNNIQIDSPDNRQRNLYTGLQLFSDIPPDDDGENEFANLSSDVSQTKRLHSVFYDDFNETLMALNNNQIKQVSKPIFSNEPLPINEETNTYNDNTTNNGTYYEVPDVEHEAPNEEVKFEISEMSVKQEEDDVLKHDIANTSIPFTKRPVSKIQMPNININVQALLPGSNTTLRMTKEDSIKPNEMDQDDKDKQVVDYSLGRSTKQETSKIEDTRLNVAKTTETEHILPNITKNRVRAPTSRRPPTRKARQESYRKSLIDEQRALEAEAEKEADFLEENSGLVKDIKTHEIFTSQVQKKNKVLIRNEKPVLDGKYSQIKLTEKVLLQANKTSSKSDLFDNEQTNIAAIVNVKENKTRSEPSKTVENSILNNKKSDLFTNTKTSKPIDNSQTEPNKVEKTDFNSKILANALLFDDEDDDDDDLFKQVKNYKIQVKKDTTNASANQIVPLENSILENDNFKSTNSSTFEENQEKNPYLLKSITDTEVTKQVPISIASDNKLNADSNKYDVLNNKSKNAIVEDKFKSSFLDDEGDDDDLFKTTIHSIRSGNEIKAKTEFRYFLDNNSDEDLTMAGIETATSTHTLPEDNAKTSTHSALPTINSGSKLFSESDTDSDDLFGKLASAKNLNNNKVLNKTSIKSSNKVIANQPQTSLFTDESDSDDFLKKASENIRKRPVSFKAGAKENKLKSASQTNTSHIFSDIDTDEDDLFSNAPVKTISSATSVKSLPTSKTTISATDISKQKSIADNPLADLL